jgi:HlyD family secretion protein
MFDFLCKLGFLATHLSMCGVTGQSVPGYVEGEFVLLSPIEVAKVRTVDVHRSAAVRKGDGLAQMDDQDAILALQQADAQLAQAKFNLQNLQQGQRSEELSVINAALAQAVARANEARTNLRRQQELLVRRVVSQAALDAAETAAKTADAVVAQQKASLSVAQLGARSDQIDAAAEALKQAQAARDTAAWRLSQRRLVAPADGTVTSVIRRNGETAGPTAPVLEFLPKGALKITLYVPETLASSYQPGAALNVVCDGCEEGLTAVVRWKATEAEFTPPVIYSAKARQKLVYLVEASLSADTDQALKPGQIVDVSLAEAQ